MSIPAFQAPVGATTIAPKFKAFLSYSHKDSAWGTWVHAALEAYRIPRDLVGRATGLGPVPAKLRPIFRDRYDLAASHTLGDTINAALAQSASLLVLCSPASAKSPYVNEEIRRFKSLGRSDRILALIVDGEPHDPARECFPDALKYKVSSDGTLTRELDAEPIAADAREHADGKDLAKLKLVAGLLGIGLDEVRKREAMAERARRRVWMGISAGMATLAVAAVVGAVVAVQQRQAADRRFEMAFKAADGLVRRVDSIQDLGVPETVLQALTRVANALLQRLTAESGADSDLFHFRQAEAYLQSANIAKRGGQTAPQRDAIDKAVALLVVLAGKDGDGRRGWRHELANVYQMRAELLAEGKDVQAAQEASKASLMILEDLAQRPEADASVRHDLANAYAADALRLQVAGSARARLAALEKSLDLRRRVAAEEPREVEYQRSYAAGLSEVAEARAQLPDAKESDFAVANAGHQAAIAAVQELTASKPLNRDLQQLLGTVHSKYGDTLVKQARFDDAMAEYNADVKITRAIADANPGYVGLQSDAAVAVSRVGILLAGRGKPAAALLYHREALERFKRVAALNPSNEEYQETVFKRLMMIVDVARKAGDLDGAITAFRESVVFREDIAKRNPQYPDFAAPAIMQRVAFSKFLGDLNRPEDALAELKMARAALFAKKQAFSNQEVVVKMLAKLDENIAQMANAQK